MNESSISEEYFEYLINVVQLKQKKSAKDYVNGLNKMQIWLVDRKIRPKDFNIWDENQAKKLDMELKSQYSEEWKIINDNNHEHRFSTPWKHWIQFLDWKGGRKEFNKLKEMGNVLTSLRSYFDTCKNTDWITNEKYKWNFSDWVSNKVDFKDKLTKKSFKSFRITRASIL